MKVSFKKKVLLPDGEHTVKITDITEVGTTNGDRLAIKITPEADEQKYQDLNIWLSEDEDAEGICGKILASVIGDEEGDYSTEELSKLLIDRELVVKTKQNTKDGKTYVNIVDVIEVYTLAGEDFDEDDSDELEDEEDFYDDEDDEEEEEEPPVFAPKRKRKSSSGSGRN